MKNLKKFLNNQDIFGKLVSFEELHKSNPIVHVLVNDIGHYFIYYESNKYGFKTTHLLEVTKEQMQSFWKENVNFNDVFTAKPLRLRIFKTHTETSESESILNDPMYGFYEYYITTYKDLTDKKLRKKESRKTYLLLYLSLLIIFMGSFFLLIPLKWLSYLLSILCILIALFLMYFSFYKMILKKNDDE